MNYINFKCADSLAHKLILINVLEVVLNICDNLKKVADELCSLEILKIRKIRYVINA